MRLAKNAKVISEYLNRCPICNEEVISVCKCRLGDRYCIHNHGWRITLDGNFIIMKNHRDKGKPGEIK